MLAKLLQPSNLDDARLGVTIAGALQRVAAEAARSAAADALGSHAAHVGARRGLLDHPIRMLELCILCFKSRLQALGRLFLPLNSKFQHSNALEERPESQQK